jgi:hypothetical protein
MHRKVNKIIKLLCVIVGKLPMLNIMLRARAIEAGAVDASRYYSGSGSGSDQMMRLQLLNTSIKISLHPPAHMGGLNNYFIKHEC